jgi:hypothetical protein
MPTNALVPDHIPPELVVDFDFFALDQLGKEDIQLAWATLHDGPDIVWTPHNGGHWIATRADCSATSKCSRPASSSHNARTN